MLAEKQIFQCLKQQYGPNLKKIGKGSSSIAYELNKKIIRVPLADIERYQKEEILLPLILPKIHVKIPQIKLLLKPIPHSIHQKLEGYNWNLNSYEKLTISQKNKFCEDIATFFYDLHSISPCYLQKKMDVKALKPYTLPTLEMLLENLQNSYSVKELEKMHQKASFLIKYPENDNVLCHKDFWHTNSVVNKSHRLTAVFDFGNSTLGEYSEDFKTLYKPSYIPLLKNTISIYNSFSSKKVQLSRIKELEDLECLFVFKYLSTFNRIKMTRNREWLLTLKQIHNFFKKYVQ